MDSFVSTYLDQVWDAFANPQKRVYVGYLASALAIGLLTLIAVQRVSLANAVRQLFSWRVWWSRSARADYLVMFVNQAVMLGLGPRLLSKLAIATLLYDAMHIWFDGRSLILADAPGWLVPALYTLTLFIFDDAAKYVLHRALHRIPALWAFHKVHHSAETLTPLTVYRTHPVEGVLFALRASVVQGSVIAIFFYFFGSQTDLVTVLGANAILFVFNAAGSNLRHSHVWLSYGPWIERVFISPAQHQIHHSIAHHHFDRNFGAVLAVWDWLGGSLVTAKGESVSGFGLGTESPTQHSLSSLYLSPFRESGDSIYRSFLKGVALMSRVNTHGLLSGRRFAALAGITMLVSGLVYAASQAEAAEQELNIYSHRQQFLIQPFIDAYEAQTGTKINIVYASKGLAQRLQAEGERSPADVILTVDIARLSVYADKDLLAPVTSEVLTKNIPDYLRDPQNRWFAFSKRARVIAVSKEVKDAQDIQRYEELADPKWKGRICSRPGSHVYNRALVASFIHQGGVEAAENWAQGVTSNLARRPQGNDRAQVKAIFEGVCDIAIINNYYYGKLRTSEKEEQKAWADAVTLIFPNQADRGAHINISGGGVAVHSKNKDEAVRFLEFLTSREAQQLYSTVNYEYPANPNVEPSEELKSLGQFKEDSMPIFEISNLAPEAQRVIDRVGW